MQENFEIDAVSRSEQGKGASRRLRREGLVPGIVYGGGKDPQMFTVKHNELIQHLDHEAFFSHILSVKLDGKPQKVVLKDLQRHPSKPFVTHIDLLRVRMDEQIRMTVPMHFEGEDASPGIKAGGTLLRGMNDLEIECLPGNLPESITVDISSLELDGLIRLSAVVMPEGVKLVGHEEFDEDNDPMVASIEIMRAAPEEDETAEGDVVAAVEPKAQSDEAPGSNED